jgi:hypothetical protein
LEALFKTDYPSFFIYSAFLDKLFTVSLVLSFTSFAALEALLSNNYPYFFASVNTLAALSLTLSALFLIYYAPFLASLFALSAASAILLVLTDAASLTYFTALSI